MHRLVPVAETRTRLIKLLLVFSLALPMLALNFEFGMSVFNPEDPRDAMFS